ncbi:hypothetical protein FA95DRAFT_1461024, partial [Auriscalpium vulgare]
GCMRCGPKDLPYCCDLCNPEHFADFACVDIVKPPGQPRRSKVDTQYTASHEEKDLKASLLEWRSQRAQEIFGAVHYKNFGPNLFMPATIVQRIVDCAHSHKLATCSDLFRQTKWHQAHQHGDELLRLI